MEIVNFERGRMTVLHEFSRMLGEAHTPTLVRRLVEDFQFSRYPNDFSNPHQNSQTFEHGVLDEVAFDLTIYNDGVMITSRSSTDSVIKIYENMMNWAKMEFSFSLHQTHSVSIMYESALTFKSEKNVLAPLDAYENAANQISKTLRLTSNWGVMFDNFGFALGADDSETRGLRPTMFRLERRAGLEFNSNLYFSTAPVRTQDHVKIIQEIERIS